MFLFQSGPQFAPITKISLDEPARPLLFQKQDINMGLAKSLITEFAPKKIPQDKIPLLLSQVADGINDILNSTVVNDKSGIFKYSGLEIPFAFYTKLTDAQKTGAFEMYKTLMSNTEQVKLMEKKFREQDNTLTDKELDRKTQLHFVLVAISLEILSEHLKGESPASVHFRDKQVGGDKVSHAFATVCSSINCASVDLFDAMKKVIGRIDVEKFMNTGEEQLQRAVFGAFHNNNFAEYAPDEQKKKYAAFAGNKNAWDNLQKLADKLYDVYLHLMPSSSALPIFASNDNAPRDPGPKRLLTEFLRRGQEKEINDVKKDGSKKGKKMLEDAEERKSA